MNRFGIRYQGQAGPLIVGATPSVGDWLESYNPDAFNGWGSAAWTSDPKTALVFEKQYDAWALWSTTSLIRPTREDGKPNKPLTACSISIELIPA